MPSAEQSSAYRHYLMKAEDLFLTRVLLLPDRVYGRVVIPTVLSAPARTRCTTAGIKEVKRGPESDVTRKFTDTRLARPGS